MLMRTFSGSRSNRQFVDRSRHRPRSFPPSSNVVRLPLFPRSRFPSRGWSMRRSRNNTKKIKPSGWKRQRGVHPSRNTLGYCFEARWPISYRPYVDGHGGPSFLFSPVPSRISSISLLRSPRTQPMAVYTRTQKRSQWPATTPKRGLCAALIMGGWADQPVDRD